MKSRVSFRDLVLGAILVVLVIALVILIRQNNSLLLVLHELKEGGVAVNSPKSPEDRPAGQPTTIVRPDEYVPVDELMRRARAFTYEIGTVGGTFRYAHTADLKTFNLVLNREATTSDKLRYCYDGLITRDPLTDEWVGALADRWELAPDGLSAVFHLRPDAVWWDHEPITADDVVFTYDDILNNALIDVGGKGALLFRDWDPQAKQIIEKEMTVEKLDDATVKFTFPFRTFRALDRCATLIYPRHVLKKYVDNGTFNTTWDLSTDPKQIMGSGPWRPWEYQPGERLVLKRVDTWYRRDAAGQRLPYLDEIVFLIVESPETALLKFKAGEIDFISASGEWYPILKELQKQKDFRIFYAGPSTVVHYMTFNLNRGHNKRTGKPFVTPYKLEWFYNLKFRQAMAYALDRNTWVNNFMNGFGRPLWSPLSPASVEFYDPDVTQYPFDLDKARALLDEIGYVDRDGDGVREDPDGHPIEFTILTAARDAKALRPITMFISDLQRIGVSASYSIQQVNTFYDKLGVEYDWECTFSGEIGGTEVYDINGLYVSYEPYRFWKPHYTNDGQPIPENLAYRLPWEDDLDRLVSEYSKELDRAKRRLIGFQIQKILSDEIPMIWTVVSEDYYAISNRFRNINPMPGFWPSIWGDMYLTYEVPDGQGATH
jgi:peptide/nickel transport system substrate-binding protein